MSLSLTFVLSAVFRRKENVTRWPGGPRWGGVGVIDGGEETNEVPPCAALISRHSLSCCVSRPSRPSAECRWQQRRYKIDAPVPPACRPVTAVHGRPRPHRNKAGAAVPALISWPTNESVELDSDDGSRGATGMEWNREGELDRSLRATEAYLLQYPSNSKPSPPGEHSTEPHSTTTRLA